MGEYTHIIHSFEPVYNENSRVLILGSLPSVKSREEGFYYGHPRNRFCDYRRKEGFSFGFPHRGMGRYRRV